MQIRKQELAKQLTPSADTNRLENLQSLWLGAGKDWSLRNPQGKVYVHVYLTVYCIILNLEHSIAAAKQAMGIHWRVYLLKTNWMTKTVKMMEVH